MNDETLPTAIPFPPAWIHFFIVLGTILVVALVVLLWVIVFYKRGDTSGSGQRRHHHHRHRHEHNSGGLRETTAGIKEIIGKNRHRHTRRHENRPMNPTLAQTGGLPPIREDSAPPTP